MPPAPGRYPLLSTEGDPYQVRVPPAADIASFFVFSFPRAGSTLLDRIMRGLCDGTDIPYLTIADDAFADGVQTGRIGPSVETLFSERGFGYLGFRHFLMFDPVFDFSAVNKVLLVRDPRDMMVSLYFSMKHSHAIPKRGAGSKRMQDRRVLTRELDINEYITAHAELDAQIFKRNVERYRRFVFDDRLRLYHYEQVIFDKAAWVRDLTGYLSIPASDKLIDRVVRQNDIFPEREDPSAHIRQVRPGNYRRHLNEDSIALLNEWYADELEYFGYER